MERLKYMKERLVECIEKEINGNLEYTNAEELGEAVDMVKDLAEAIYYCTITEAMEGKSPHPSEKYPNSTHYYGDGYMPYPRYDEPPYPMYYGGRGDAGGNGGGPRYYSREVSYPHHNPTHPTQGDPNSDRSWVAKKRYMEGRMFNDKASQMRDLEQYAQELIQDVTDMIKDASPEEKQVLQQKISLLASKIK